MLVPPLCFGALNLVSEVQAGKRYICSLHYMWLSNTKFNLHFTVDTRINPLGLLEWKNACNGKEYLRSNLGSYGLNTQDPQSSFF